MIMRSRGCKCDHVVKRIYIILVCVNKGDVFFVIITLGMVKQML